MPLVGERTFRALFRNVLEPLRLRARGGDDETDWIAVALRERPAFETLAVRATLPAYTGQGTVPLPAGQSAYTVLAGSRLEIAAEASKPLLEAVLQRDDARLEALELQGRRTFVFAVAPDALQTGIYGLQITDTDGLACKRPATLSIRVRPDDAPRVTARLDGISSSILARAQIPMIYKAEDDFCVAELRVRCSVQMPAADEDGDAAPPAAETKSEESPVAIEPGSKAAGRHVLDAAPLRLAPGAHLSFFLQATDNDAVTGPKSGNSGTFVRRVVSLEEFRAELLRREQELRQELEGLLRDQTEMLEDTRVVQAAGQSRAQLADKEAHLLARTEKRQRLAAGRALGLATKFEQILAEVRNNRLEEEGGPFQERLARRIIAPLGSLGTIAIPAAADSLAEGMHAEGADVRSAALGRAEERQAEIIAQMRAILRHLVKSESFQEALNLLHEILSNQREVNKATQERRTKDIEGLFE